MRISFTRKEWENGGGVWSYFKNSGDLTECKIYDASILGGLWFFSDNRDNIRGCCNLEGVEPSEAPIKYEVKEKEEMQCDFSDYKVGDKVWHIKNGWTKINKIEDTILFTPLGDFYQDGLSAAAADTVPTYFPNEFTIPPEAYKRPLPEYKVCQILEVRDFEHEPWKLRRFHSIKNGSVYVKLECGDNAFYNFYRIPEDLKPLEQEPK